MLGLKSPIQREDLGRSAIAASEAVNNQEHRKESMLTDVRRSLARVNAELQEKENELRREGVKARTTAAGLAALSTAFISVGERFDQTAANFAELRGEVAKAEEAIAEVDALLEQLNAGVSGAGAEFESLVNKIKTIGTNS